MYDQIMVFINNKKYETVDKREIFGYVLGICMEQLQYMSREAILSWIEECCVMMDEVSEWEKVPLIKRKVTSTRNYLEKNADKMDREKVMSYIMNLILSSQNLGVFARFGYARKK